MGHDVEDHLVGLLHADGAQTREVADALIERVELFENDVVRVVFKFHDVFEYTRDFMEKGGFI